MYSNSFFKINLQKLQKKIGENIINAIEKINLNGLDCYYKEFHAIHKNLKAGSSETAAKEISHLID